MTGSGFLQGTFPVKLTVDAMGEYQDAQIKYREDGNSCLGIVHLLVE
ncbi:hypothetical protein Mucpa_1993 [Mucilaginibacter paludis DSM 18603]|uniref:Uncharacterized protein n=1 Tax=Mucilaginibacter paludis DSM 18603 TaxID=714943 RepID=H1YE71_9SPHI|nr:hypothetical protein Mucpa_1993 [Mucilaginibacter paludis DSM 18603]